MDPSGKTHDLLADLAEEKRWPQHPDRTISTARGLYLPLRDGAKLWAGKARFEDATGRVLSEILAGAPFGTGPHVKSRAQAQSSPRTGLTS